MASHEVEVCLKLVELRFGALHRDIAKKISEFYGGVTFVQLANCLVNANKTKFTSENIRNTLVELIQCGYLDYIQNDANQTERNPTAMPPPPTLVRVGVTYRLAVEYILTGLWHAQYSHYVGVKYGNTAKMVILHLLVHGATTVESLFNHFVTNANVGIDNLIHSFRNLSSDRILVYHKNWLKDLESGVDLIEVDIDDNADRLYFIHTDETTLQELKKVYRKDNQPVTVGISRKRRISDGPSIEDKIPFAKRLVCANYNALTLLLQNELMKQFAISRFDSISSNIICAILDHQQEDRALNAPSSLPMNFYKILRYMNQFNVTEDDLKFYLVLLQGEDFRRVIIKIDDHKMGDYCVNLRSIYRDYVEKSMSVIVSKKYGPEAGRICKSVLHYKFMDPKQISRCCLLEVAETQSLLQKLYKDQILNVNLIPKGVETRPLKSVCVVHTDIDRIASILKSDCIQFIDKLLTLRCEMKIQNKVIIEKGEKLVKIIEKIKQQQHQQNDSNSASNTGFDDLLNDQSNALSDNEKKTYDHLQLHFQKIDVSLANLSQQYFLIKYYMQMIHLQNS